MAQSKWTKPRTLAKAKDSLIKNGFRITKQHKNGVNGVRFNTLVQVTIDPKVLMNSSQSVWTTAYNRTHYGGWRLAFRRISYRKNLGSVFKDLLNLTKHTPDKLDYKFQPLPFKECPLIKTTENWLYTRSTNVIYEACACYMVNIGDDGIARYANGYDPTMRPWFFISCMSNRRINRKDTPFYIISDGDEWHPIRQVGDYYGIAYDAMDCPDIDPLTTVDQQVIKECIKHLLFEKGLKPDYGD